MFEEEHRPPLALLGLPLKPLIMIIVLLLCLLLSFDRIEVTDIIPQQIGTPPKGAPADGNLVASPEMVTRAMQQIQENKRLQVEEVKPDEPGDRFFYIIELTDGGDLEGTDVSIKADSVTISSAEGITTTLPRSTVKRVSRVKLPPQPPQ